MDGWMDGYQKSITRQILTKEKRKERIVTFEFFLFFFFFFFFIFIFIFSINSLCYNRYK